MQEFDRGKLQQLLIGICGVYLIYSYAGLLQEAMYHSSHPASNRNTSTTSLESMTIWICHMHKSCS